MFRNNNFIVLKLSLLIDTMNSRTKTKLFHQNHHEISIKRFKNKLRESSPIDNCYANSYSPEMCNRISPQRKHSTFFKNILNTGSYKTKWATKLLSEDVNSEQRKIVERDPSFQESSRQATLSQDITEQGYKDILLRIFQEIQYQKDIYIEGNGLEENQVQKRNLSTIEQCVVIAGILLENANRLRMYQDFYTEAKHLYYFIKRTIIKIHQVFQNKKKYYNLILKATIDQQQSTEEENGGGNRRMLKISNNLSMKGNMTNNIKERAKKSTMNPNKIEIQAVKDSGKAPGSRVSSLVSFSIQNEDKHDDYSLRYQQWYNDFQRQKETLQNPQYRFISQCKRDENFERTCALKNQVVQSNSQDYIGKIDSKQQLPSEDSELNRYILNQVIQQINKQYSKFIKFNR